MRDLTATADATAVVAEAVERHHPKLVLLCSFQKEESVLIDLLMQVEPNARVFTIDTGVLFPDTYAVWKKVEDRYGLSVEVFDAFVDRVGTERFEQEVKGLALPVEFNLENLQHFIDWSRSEPYQVIRGEGECAV